SALTRSSPANRSTATLPMSEAATSLPQRMELKAIPALRSATVRELLSRASSSAPSHGSLDSPANQLPGWSCAGECPDRNFFMPGFGFRIFLRASGIRKRRQHSHGAARSRDQKFLPLEFHHRDETPLSQRQSLAQIQLSGGDATARNGRECSASRVFAPDDFPVRLPRGFRLSLRLHSFLP